MTKLPRSIIVTVAMLCVLPIVLNGFGVSFATRGAELDRAMLAALEPQDLTDQLHLVLSGSFTHTILEWSAFCAAIFTVVLSFSYYRIQRDVTTPILGVALLCAGCMDAFHTLAADRLIEAVAPNQNLIPFTWALCRLANVLLTLLGVSLFFFTQPKQWKNTSLVLVGVSLGFALLSYGVIHLCATREVLPQTQFPDALITRPWDVLPLILFIFAGLVVYPRFYQQYPSIFSHSLIISTLPNVATQLHMSFGSTALFDNHFNIAHGLKIVSYLVPLTGLVLNYNQVHYHMQVMNQKLEVEIGERQMTQEALLASEHEARQKSEDLEQTLRELKKAQLYMIQTEKMSGLGQLVAGIAHEINNPVNFIYGNLKHAHSYVNSLLKLIEAYERTYPDSLDRLQAEREDADLEFIQEDLPKLLQSMQVGSDRIRNIILSLRTFSRLDESAQKEVDVHEGLESTLLILQSRIKAKAERPEIEIIKSYGLLPKITCFAGQLNQVFMNVLANAIDALEESCEGRSFEDLKASTLWIRITTEPVNAEWVRICFQDNGPGMSDETLQRIYEPFFTTKIVGKGTGMGLALSYQVVTDTHQGVFRCQSALGQGTEFVIELPIQQPSLENTGIRQATPREPATPGPSSEEGCSNTKSVEPETE